MPAARLVTIVVLAVLGCVLVLHDRVELTSAADSEAVTWGATDPTWSPDGNELAFSLFGSIWRVPADGGEAEQLTSSAGYHAHPAWSPSGETIAFIQGEPPRGRMPNVAGRLMTLHVASGRIREVKTPYPLAGTPAWSPDSWSIVCGLKTPDEGVLLHEITIAVAESKDGARVGGDASSSRQLHQRPRRPADGPPTFSEGWIDSAWSAENQQIYFIAKRGGPPQVCTMAAGSQPIVVQTPLTRYRYEDILLPHSLSAVPDGSGIIYSADVVNGKGDYELYRIPAEGGEPVNITATPRDEFAPAVSPDGKTIAHVSNHLATSTCSLCRSPGARRTRLSSELGCKLFNLNSYVIMAKDTRCSKG